MSFKKLKRTPFIILGILGRGPLSGYEVQKAIKTSTGFFWQESFGQIYPALFELEKSGSVTKKLDKT